MTVNGTHVGDVCNDEERVKDALLVAQRGGQTPDLTEMQPHVADWCDFTRAPIGLSVSGRGRPIAR